MCVNVGLDRTFSYLLSLMVLAITSGVGACTGFLIGIFGLGGAWLIGLAAGKGFLTALTAVGALIGLLSGVKYCKRVYWSDQKLR